jgi:hypothetical protein
MSAQLYSMIIRSPTGEITAVSFPEGSTASLQYFENQSFGSPIHTIELQETLTDLHKETK